MKLRNVVIVLLAIFMVFAFASCSNEPKNNPQPGPTGVNQTYRLTATKSRVDKWYTDDKFALDFTLLDDFSVKENDVISFSYRSTMEFEEYSIRHGDYCWVYEDSKEALTSYEVGEDGWIKVSYKFGPKCFLKDNHVPRSEWELEPVPYPETFRFDLRGYVFAGDILEIKDLALNGNYLTLTQNLIASDYCAPTLVVVDENTPAFPGARDFAVIYGEGSLSNSNAPLSYELVEEGGKVAHVPTRDHYTISLYTTSDATKQNEETLFNPAEATITKDTVLYIVAVPETYKVTYVYNNGSENTVVDAEYGSLLTAPADPEKQGQVFAGWFKDDKLTVPFDFAEELISEDTPIYAAWGDPVAITFDAENGAEDEVTVVNAAKGYPVAPLADPTFGSKLFLGWFLDGAETAYDFSTPVSEAITLYAHWVNATDVTLKEGTKTLKTFQAALDEALASTNENLVLESRIASFFDGWYTDAELTKAYDFATTVTGPLTLYAKWRDGKVAQIISTYNYEDNHGNYDKFRIKFDSGSYKTYVKGGDVLTFKYRSTTPITKFNVRGDKKWVYQQNFDTPYLTAREVGADGWISVTYTFPYADGTNTFDDDQGKIPTDFYVSDRAFYFDFIAYTIVKGDILEVKGITLNGKELTIDAGNIQSGTSSTKPTYNSEVTTDYEWAKQTVTFNTGVADAIEPIKVDFGGRATRPATDPAKTGYHFVGWYADSEFKKEFDFTNTVITKATTIYAKIGVAKTVTFNSNGGSAVADIEVASGDPVAKPADPSKNDVIFAGWFSDAELNTAYDFNTPVTTDITLYAKWISPKKLTLDLNYENSPAATVLDVEGGAEITVPKNPSRVGYFFGGWYKDKGFENAFDFTKGITENTSIYAKWDSPTESYKYTIKAGGETDDRAQWIWDEDDCAGLADVKKGDVFTFMLKTTPSTGKAITNFRLRNANEDDIDLKYVDLPEAGADDWISATIVIPKDAGAGFVFGLYAAGHPGASVLPGDILEIKAVALNGVAITVGDLDTGYSTAADMEVIKL